MIKAKICVIGNQKVGKTSLILRYVKNRFPTDYKPTIGANFLEKYISPVELKELDGDQMQLLIWDLEGQWNPSKDTLKSYYYKGAHGFIMVYDITDKQSLKDLDHWYKRIKEKVNDVPFIVVGNKIDLENQSAIKRQDFENFKKKHNWDFVKASAKTGYNVADFFLLLAKKIVLKHKKHLVQQMN
ncbi:MAG: Rab family GTPase [Promethearchaeota archaeon]